MGTPSAILEVTGCCSNYKAEMFITLGDGRFITISARGRTASKAHVNLMEVATGLAIPGFDPSAARVRHWSNK